jgi:hypothetical protein
MQTTILWKLHPLIIVWGLESFGDDPNLIPKHHGQPKWFLAVLGRLLQLQ